MKKVSSVSILKDFISSKLQLFEDIELTAHALTCASIKVSGENVVESLVSDYETHFYEKRGLEEKTKWMRWRLLRIVHQSSKQKGCWRRLWIVIVKLKQNQDNSIYFDNRLIIYLTINFMEELRWKFYSNPQST